MLGKSQKCLRHGLQFAIFYIYFHIKVARTQVEHRGLVRLINL